MESESPIWTDPERMGGVPCFRGSRVTVKSLFDWLERGYALDEFLENFPTVTRERAAAVLRMGERLVLSTQEHVAPAA